MSCPAVSECVAVGAYASAGYYQGWLLRWSGGSWSTAEAPLPGNAAGVPDAMLNQVSCPSTSECVAAGDYYLAAGAPTGEGLVLTWTGGSWTPQELPDTADGAVGDQGGLACPTTSACISVDGGWATSLSASGGSWSTTGIGTGVFWGLSCLTASECVVGGNPVADNGGWSALRVWSGDWTLIATPLPANADGNPQPVVYGVSCPAAGICVAVGSYEVSADQTQALLLTGPA